MKDIKDSKVCEKVWGGGYASFNVNSCHQSSIFVEIDIATLTHHFSKSVVYIRDQWLYYILYGFRQMCNDIYLPFYHLGFPGSSDKEFTCNAGDLGPIPGSIRSPTDGSGNPLQYSCLENPMDRRAWHATVHGVTKYQTLLKWFSRLTFYLCLLLFLLKSGSCFNCFPFFFISVLILVFLLACSFHFWLFLLHVICQ